MESYAIYILARLIIGFFRIIPRSAGILLIKLLASLAYYLDFRHRHIAMVNLQIAFPAITDRARKRIALKSFQNISLNLLEISRLPLLSPENVASLVEYDDDESLKNYESARAKGKGILYLTGHFSAWELLPSAHALHGRPLSFLTRPLDNALLEQYLLKIRESKGNQVIDKNHSARKILQKLNSGGAVGILMDHNTTLNEGVFVDFFGVPAATTTSVALFALRTEAPVLPGYLTPLHKGRYAIKFLHPIDVVRTSDMKRDIEMNTKIFNEVLEKIICSQPESWLWGHKRWKNQPPGNPQNLYNLSKQDLNKFLQRNKNATDCMD